MYDILIIGSGPAGLTAAIYAKRAQLSFAVIEKEYMGTGQIAEASRVDNYPGLKGIDGFELGDKFREHAESLGAEFIDAEASEILQNEKYYTVKLTSGDALDTKTIIYAAGASHRKLGIKGEAEFTGRGVSYCAVCDSAFYEGKSVAVLGGGDTALDDAYLLSRTASKVYLVHRRDEFRANKSLQELIRSTDNIIPVLSAIPVEIIGKETVTSLRYASDNKDQYIDIDGVFVAVGMDPDSALLKGIADLDEAGYVIADETGRTSAKGIFAAGDIRKKQLRQVITAAADGANCVFSAEKYLSQNNW